MIIYLMVYLPLPIFWKIGFAHTSVMQRAAAARFLSKAGRPVEFEKENAN